jgi:hypothetical protein
MISLPHIEDYIELLAGYDPGLNGTSAGLIFNSSKYNFSLARYDVSIIGNMAASTLWNGQAYTDKQGELAVKLVLKYRRQFASQGIDVAHVEEKPQFRQPVRTIDRSRRIWREGEDILVKFPYDQDRIEDLRKLRETGQGRSKWNRDDKIWQLGITEYNVNYIVIWGQAWNFEIDPQVTEMFNLLLTCECEPYEIKLVRKDSGYEIINASNSLKEYVSEHIGDDFVKLIDHAGVLGYTVDADLLEEASVKYGQALEYIGTKHNVHLEPRRELAEWIFDYAEMTNRYPICIYDPSPLPIDQSLVDLDRFNEKDIVRFDLNGKTKTSDYDPYNVKVIYAKKLPKTWEFPIPLLVSTQQMMYGGRKLDWLNRAEKIVYFCHNIREKD